MDCLVYTPLLNSRIKYICKQVFEHWLGLKTNLTTDLSFYKTYEGAIINYGEQRILDRELYIPRCAFLLGLSIQKPELSVFSYYKIPALFRLDTTEANFPFDILANIFFHLSRYEEYLPFEADQHGRFPADQSWAYRQDCLQRPVVNLLIGFLKKILLQKFPFLTFKKQSFQFLPTYDIDMAWAFRYKGWKRGIGGYANDLLKGKWASLKSRISTHAGFQKDPFQTFDLLEKWTEKYQLNPIYFFLLSDYGSYDKNNALYSKAFKKLIWYISRKYKTGIHPSYQSAEDQSFIRKETNRLASIIKQPVCRSRQHYLKIHLPVTYRHLLAAGIKMDYSMGYAMNTGFRAGTALPFYWYDLEKEAETNLLIHPFQVMDVTLKQYLQLSPKAAKDRIKALIQAVKSVDGIFCSLWHNSSFSELEGWSEWRAVYEALLQAARDKEI